MMPGVEFGEFQKALVDAFGKSDLEQMVRVRLNEKLDTIVEPGSVKNVTFQLLTWAEQHGFEADLARAAYLERPRNERVRRVYEKFGMAPAVAVQQAGEPIAIASAYATAAGFEATVKPHLRTVDIGVWRDNLARIESQVCRIEFSGNARGTGFLVGPDLVLTNFHVVEGVNEGKPPSAQVGCRFDYKVLSDGSRSEGVVVGLHADWKLDESRYSRAEADNDPDRELPHPDELDYALVRLARAVGREPTGKNSADAPPRGWIELPQAQPALATGLPLMIVQHPDGSPLKLAFDTQSIIGVNANGTRVRYATNTDAGSSGSPCFNMDWALVALHHLGDPAWKSPKYNQGVPIGAIANRVAKKIEVHAS